MVTPEIIKACRSACGGYGNKLEEVNARNCVCSGGYEESDHGLLNNIWVKP